MTINELYDYYYQLEDFRRLGVPCHDKIAQVEKQIELCEHMGEFAISVEYDFCGDTKYYVKQERLWLSLCNINAQGRITDMYIVGYNPSKTL